MVLSMGDRVSWACHAVLLERTATHGHQKRMVCHGPYNCKTPPASHALPQSCFGLDCMQFPKLLEEWGKFSMSALTRFVSGIHHGPGVQTQGRMGSYPVVDCTLVL